MQVPLKLLFIAAVCMPHGTFALELNSVIRDEEMKKDRRALSSLDLGVGSATQASGEKDTEATSEEYLGLESNAEVKGESRKNENDSEYEDKTEALHSEQVDTATATAADVGIPVGVPVEVEIDSDGSSLSEDAIHMRVRVNAENTARRQDLAAARAAARAAAAAEEEAYPSTFLAKVPCSHALIPSTCSSCIHNTRVRVWHR
jgi:hypothetical protein